MKNKLLKELTLLLFLCFGSSIIFAQTVKGTVSDALGPVPGANVLIKGTTTGTVTDFDGNFEISANQGDIIVVSYVGYLTQELPYTGQETINITLQQDAALLDEVVVVGYGKTVKKEDLTGAVSVVGVKDIEKSPLTNVDQALQGRASGVQITQSSGAPGAGFKIRVRGSNSITGNNSPLVVVDGLIDVDINSVNPSDIASISVLKDASSSAIYGNRAANGVIIITTKKGTVGKPVIEFGTYMSFSGPSDRVDLLSVSEFIDFANFLNVGQSGIELAEFNTQQKISDRIANSVDYQDAVFRSAAVAQNYQLSFRGGSENMNYFISGNYFDQEGVAINTNFKRYALRANVNSDLTEKLTLNTSINLTRQVGLNNDPGFGADLALGAIGFDKTTPIFDENGNYNRQTTVTSGVQTSVLTNPVFRANESNGTSTVNRVQANVSLNYNLLKNLDFNISGGINYANIAVATFTPPATDALNIVAYQEAINNNNTQYAFRLNYNNTFNEKHNIEASAIYEERQSTSTNFNANGSGFFTGSTGFDNLGLADTQTIGSGTSERNLRSLIGRATYNFDSRYLVTASIRYDESSVFLKDQGGVFPSFALGWNINNEDFFESETISNLRLRGGWGQTGNELIGTSDALNLLRNNPWLPFGGNGGGYTAILPGTRLANPDLTWETTTQTNIGLDLGILNDRFSLSFEYYVKNTEDLLLTRLVPRFTGRVDQVVNAGEVENKGFDLTLFGRIIQNDNFNWEMSANISSNKNEVKSLIGGETEIFPGLVAGPNIPVPTIVRVGEPIGTFYGFVYDGVDQNTGEAIYADTDEPNNQAIIGDANPDFTYGINSNMSYKGFDLNIFIQGVSGNDVYNRGRALILGRDGRIPFGTSAELRNTWSATNTSGTLPSLLATNVQNESSEFIEDGSFLRLKNISLGYTLRDVNALNTIGAESLRLYVSAQNLFTITDYSGLDPEVNNGGQDDRLAGVDIGALPTPKTFTLGLNLKF
ncbi:SusC/RagA family TonB-linked outer membrane protein [Aestuariivivens sediminis]|uniref:SusC/RagA family TonB-linked outer membrane protein n=1 Tax=Aestuariivivens sediminis TaxID=2913557 RepID=UPI001F5ACF5E|nr:TonB-dependent receptor [Aestuariivivens sediminis]